MNVLDDAYDAMMRACLSSASTAYAFLTAQQAFAVVRRLDRLRSARARTAARLRGLRREYIAATDACARRCGDLMRERDELHADLARARAALERYTDTVTLTAKEYAAKYGVSDYSDAMDDFYQAARQALGVERTVAQQPEEGP